MSGAQQVTLVALRTLIGWHFLYEGYVKLLTPSWGSDGVPMAAWCGIFLADLMLRKRDYDDAKLFDHTSAGYGSVNVVSVVLMAFATIVGWGLVIDTTGAGKGLSWLGFLLEPLGLGGRDGAWAYANLGVPVALALGFLGYLVLQASAVRRQEETP